MFYSTIFTLPIFLALPFGVRSLENPFNWAVAVLSGLSFAAALFAMFVAIQKSEISHIGPLLGAVVPLFVFIIIHYVLGAYVSPQTILGIFVLIVGSFVISIEKSSLHSGWHLGTLWGIIAGFAFAVSHVSASYIYQEYGFFSGFVYTRGFIGLVGLALLLLPSIRRELFKKKSVLHRSKNKNCGVLVAVEKIIGVIGVVCIQYAIALGDVVVVNALAGVQFALLIIAVALLSKFSPQTFKESYRGQEIFQEILGVVIIAVGLVLIIR